MKGSAIKLRRLSALVFLTAIAALGSACGGSAPAGESVQAEQSTADPRAGLEAALGRSAAETSSRIVMETTGTSVVTEIDRTAEVMHSTSAIEVEGMSMKSESLMVDGVRYYRSHETDVTKAKWAKSELGTMASTYFSRSMFSTESFLTGESTVTLESTDRYKITSPAEGLFGGMEGMATEAGEAMTVTLDDQGRIGKIEMDGPDGDITITAEYDVTIKAEPPSADQID